MRHGPLLSLLTVYNDHAARLSLSLSLSHSLSLPPCDIPKLGHGKVEKL